MAKGLYRWECPVCGEVVQTTVSVDLLIALVDRHEEENGEVRAYKAEQAD